MKKECPYGNDMIRQSRPVRAAAVLREGVICRIESIKIEAIRYIRIVRIKKNPQASSRYVDISLPDHMRKVKIR